MSPHFTGFQSKGFHGSAPSAPRSSINEEQKAYLQLLLNKKNTRQTQEPGLSDKIAQAQTMVHPFVQTNNHKS